MSERDLEDAIALTKLSSAFNLSHLSVCVTTMGCAHNYADSDYILSLLREYGARVAEYAFASVLYVNSCTVKTPSEEKALFQALKALEAGKIVVLGGCVPQAAKHLKRLDPWVAAGRCLIVGILDEQTLHALFASLESMTNIGDGKASENCYALQGKAEHYRDLGYSVMKAQLWRANYDVSRLPRIRTHAHIDIVPLCSGCLGCCTYCYTVYARGRLKSQPIDKIKARLQAGIDSGEISEVWFTGEDTLAWGYEQGDDFSHLWREIEPLFEGTSIMVRIGMTDPESVVGREEALGRIFQNVHVYKFLHLPIQSASDAVLQAMKRRYSFLQYKELVYKLRSRVPGMALATDYIAGFPGETEQDHQQSVYSIAELGFEIVNVTYFYPRSGTVAAHMSYLPQDVKRRRSAELHQASIIDFSLSRRQFIGQVHNVAVFEVLYKPYLGRFFGCKTINQISVALEWFYDDYISQDANTAEAEHRGVRIGSIVCCRIKEATRVGLVGTFIRVCASSELVGLVGKEADGIISTTHSY